MGRPILSGLTALSIAVSAILPSGAAIASPQSGQSREAVEAAHRVNLAGRQRMLSQLMSKAACFIATDTDSANQQERLSSAVDLFARTHDALRLGDDELGFEPEENPMLLEAIALAGADWNTYSGLINTALSNGYVSLPAMERIDEVGLVLLTNMNRAVNKIASAYGEALPDMPLILSLTIDLAGRQRMFTQKAAKEFCLIEAGVDVEENRANLAKTAQLFTLTLGALQNGMPGMVIPAPDQHISEQLTAVAEAWARPSAVLEAAIRGEEISASQRSIIVNELDQVMALMNEAVEMYEEVIPEPE